MANVLIVEAKEADSTLLAGMLADGVDGQDELHSCCVHGLADAILMVDDMDVILLNLMLPDSKGIDTLESIKDATCAPVVVIINQNDAALGSEAIKCGALDYLVKGQFDRQTLVRAVLFAIERYSRKSMEDCLHIIAKGMKTFKQTVVSLKDEVRSTRETVNTLYNNRPVANVCPKAQHA